MGAHVISYNEIKSGQEHHSVKKRKADQQKYKTI
jgi:hypothetical protein